MNNFADYIYNYTAGKSVCILGFGREGRSTYKILSKFCSPASIAIADLNHISRADNNLPDSVELLCGESYQDGLDRFDLVFKSPGIVLQRQPDDLKCKITSETQVFFEVFRDQIIGMATSPTSGYDYRMINAGEILNQGFEITFGARLVQVKDFSWDLNNWY